MLRTSIPLIRANPPRYYHLPTLPLLVLSLLRYFYRISDRDAKVKRVCCSPMVRIIRNMQHRAFWGCSFLFQRLRVARYLAPREPESTRLKHHEKASAMWIVVHKLPHLPHSSVKKQTRVAFSSACLSYLPHSRRTPLATTMLPTR